MFSGSGTTRVANDSFGKLNGAGPMCAPTGTTRLFYLAKDGFHHGTEDERKIYGTGKDSTTHKNGVHTVSEAHRSFTK